MGVGAAIVDAVVDAVVDAACLGFCGAVFTGLGSG